MTVEPMTDADKAITRLAEYVTAAGARSRSGTIRLAWADAAWLISRGNVFRAERDAERSRADAAEAERDAAVARAMPEARLIQTKEEAAQLPAGIYYVSPAEASEGWFAVEALDTVSGPRWLYLDDGDPRGDHMIAGCLVIRLPDLPTPTAGETL